MFEKYIKELKYQEDLKSKIEKMNDLSSKASYKNFGKYFMCFSCLAMFVAFSSKYLLLSTNDIANFFNIQIFVDFTSINSLSDIKESFDKSYLLEKDKIYIIFYIMPAFLTLFLNITYSLFYINCKEVVKKSKSIKKNIKNVLKDSVMCSLLFMLPCALILLLVGSFDLLSYYIVSNILNVCIVLTVLLNSLKCYIEGINSELKLSGLKLEKDNLESSLLKSAQLIKEIKLKIFNSREAILDVNSYLNPSKESSLFDRYTVFYVRNEAKKIMKDFYETNDLKDREIERNKTISQVFNPNRNKKILND